MVRLTIFNFALAGLLVGVSSLTGRADSIYLYNQDGSTALKPFRDNITILRSKDKSFVFRTGAGIEQEIEFAKVSRISVTSDPSLTEADDAFVSQRFDQAVDLYLKALRSNEAWKVQWITPRLSKAASQTKRFDAALNAYIGYARLDPPAALAHKPTLPEKGSRFLDEALKQLQAAIQTADNPNQKQALLSLLLDVQMKKEDTAAAEATASALMSMGGAVGDDPRLAEMVTAIRLDQAELELRAGRPERVSALISPVAPKVLSPEAQARALFLLAQSQAVQAGQDAGRQRDAAIAHMRVAAHFASVEGKPYVAQSLLEAARLCEASGERESARALYSQITTDFADSSFALEAQQRLNAIVPASQPVQ